MADKIVRKEFTTRGIDPTLVITYTWNNVEIMEFQGVYVVTIDGIVRNDMSNLGRLVHKALEAEHWLAMEQEDSEFEYLDNLFHGGM